MEANLAVEAEERQAPRRFPYANWGAAAAVLGVPLAIGTGLVLGVMLAIPALIAEDPPAGESTSTANALAQLGAAIAFLMVPMLIVARRGAKSIGEALSRLGVRRFRPSAVLWMVAAIFAYLAFAALYVALAGEPEQEDIAEGFGAIPVQILLIVFAASISEEICFRGFLFGGLRERFPRLAAALLSAVIFGALHALTGISAVPPLIAFGFVLALLYEKTGSIVPGIILHMLNNSVALLAQ
jgi:uncharacterized protein